MVKIGALWKAREGSKAVLSGKIGDANLLVFKNNFKKEGSKQPDYIVYVAESKKKSQAQESTNEPYMPDGNDAKPEEELPF